MMRNVSPSARSARRVWAISRASVGVTPAIGSSSRISLGSVISARPSSSSFFWPPERSEAGASITRVRLSRCARQRALGQLGLPASRDASPEDGGHEILAGLAVAVEEEVLEHREAREAAGDLERAYEPGLGDAIGAPAGDVAAGEEDTAGLGRDQAGDAVEDRGLAGAVGADQAGDGAGLDDEVHSVERADAVEAALQTADLEQGHVARNAIIGGVGGNPPRVPPPNNPMLSRLTVNGEPVAREIDPRRSLSDFLREDLGLTGTHVGCEHGVCGACTVLLNGESARACIMLAVQAEGAELMT